MPPEIALRTRPVDGRADLYALGCVAYWLLTGRTPFEAPTAVAMLMQHVQEDAKPPSEVSELAIPAELDRLVLDCLAKDPDDRPANAGVLYRRLAECPVPDPWDRDRAVAWWALHLSDLDLDPSPGQDRAGGDAGEATVLYVEEQTDP